MSCELGLQKPDVKIFEKCTEMLAVVPDECIYVGDGGSFELETARDIGMHPIQATWYLKEGANQPAKRKADFTWAQTPTDILSQIKKYN